MLKLNETTQAVKKDVTLKYVFAPENTVVKTLEGNVSCQAGDAILTGTKGESWPIKRDKFEETYNFSSDGTCSKKAMPVKVVRKSEPFEVKVSWSEDKLQGKTGDILVEYGPNDYGVVDWEIFLETYEILN